MQAPECAGTSISDTSNTLRLRGGNSSDNENENMDKNHESETEAEQTEDSDAWLYEDVDIPRSLTGTNMASQNQLLNRPLQRQAARAAVSKSKKAAIKIASFNINGYGHQSIYNPANKWQHVNQVMRDKRIAILMVQEAHLTEGRVNEIHTMAQRRLHVVQSSDPENPTGRGGMAFVLNKQHLKVQDIIEPTEIVPGRALLLRITVGEKEIKLLNIYAPNTSSENTEFWKTLQTFFHEHPTLKPDVTAGDFNMVEEAIDRLPMRMIDGNRVLQAFDDFKTTLHMTDGWRSTYPDSTRHTYRQQQVEGSKSRLDRIYVKRALLRTARKWKIEECGITSDHTMVSVHVVQEDAPAVGKGQWTFPDFLLKDKILVDFMIEKGNETLQAVNQMKLRERDPADNPQTQFAAFKKGITDKAKEREKSLAPRTAQCLRRLEDKLCDVLHSKDLNETERVTESSRIMVEMEKVERERHLKERCNARAHNHLEGETVSRYWSAVNKDIKPRDVFLALRKPTPETQVEENEEVENPPLDDPYEKDSQRMAELARNYHNNIQQDGAQCTISPERQVNIDTALNAVKTALTPEQAELVGSKIEFNEVVEALKAGGTAKSPGLDGITYEVYKMLDRLHEKNVEIEDQISFNITELLREVFEDIMESGVDSATDFTEGWMCPLYKKNDRNDIANFRPLTILNTDYKLFTKFWAIRFSKFAPDVLHESQAGFVTGRKISDQTKLIQVMIEYAESCEQNGLIVALDQEKAYDKIDHVYLWLVLKKFGIPDSVISTLKSLYTHAETGVMINGHLSSKFKVTRGVRQGDPLSCLLFDLAIEPLAAMLRESNLKGFQIPGHAEKLIANLFADDTTVFLAASDKFEDLQTILAQWCSASTAKFNINKTEIIPIGTLEYRKKVLQSRLMNETATPIPQHLRITKDGDAIRILGAWVGNMVNNIAVWSPTLEKIDTHLDRWSQSHPTMEGRRLIVQMVVGGMTQYLTQVQGMPKKIEARLVKRIRKFIWADKSVPPVNTATLYMPIQCGGRAVLDIVARNEAIKLMWLQRYLTIGNGRALWAKVADCISAKRVPLSQKNVPLELRINIFLQSWQTEVGHQAPTMTRELVKTAKKHKVRIEGYAFPIEVIRSVPIWYHGEARSGLRRYMNGSAAARCLRQKHKVITVGDAEEVANAMHDPLHEHHEQCACTGCEHAGNIQIDCARPHICAQLAEKLLSFLPPKWNPRKVAKWKPKENPIYENDTLTDIAFPKDTAPCNDTGDFFRAYTMGKRHNKLPKAIRSDGIVKRMKAHIKVHVNTSENHLPTGLHVALQEINSAPNNITVLMPENMRGDSITAEMIGILIAATQAPGKCILTITVPSKTTIRMLTKDVHKLEAADFVGSHCPEALRATIGALRNREGRTSFVMEKQKASTGMDDLSKEASINATLLDEEILKVPRRLRVTGANLALLTQSKAYALIRRSKSITYQNRRSTSENMEKIHENMIEVNGYRVRDEMIWKAVRSKAISRQARYFLWMTIHNAYMVGSNWNRNGFSDELKARATCAVCQKEESMHHILFKCKAVGRKSIWKTAKAITGLKGGLWHPPNLGTILMEGVPPPPGLSKKTKIKMAGARRFHQIIMTKAAHMIWKLRCERVIPEGIDDEGEAIYRPPFTKNETHNRLIKAVNAKLQLEIASTNIKFGKKALAKALVVATWDGTILQESPGDENWLSKKGVLVGIELREDDGRDRDR